MITESSIDPVVIIDSVANIKSCNREFLQLLGYSRWEVIGRNVKMIMPVRYQKNHDKLVQRYVKSKMKRIIGEKRDNIFAMKRDGTEIPVILKVSEFNAGNEIAFIGL